MGAKQSFVSGILDLGQYNQDGLGTIRYENNAIWKYVQFAGTTAVVAGNVVCYVVSTADGNAVIVDYANSYLGAGVAPVAVPAGAVAFGWIQIRGVVQLASAVGGAPTIGQALTTVGATAGLLTLLTTIPQQPCAYYYPSQKVLCNFHF